MKIYLVLMLFLLPLTSCAWVGETTGKVHAKVENSLDGLGETTKNVQSKIQKNLDELDYSYSNSYNKEKKAEESAAQDKALNK